MIFFVEDRRDPHLPSPSILTENNANRCRWYLLLTGNDGQGVSWSMITSRDASWSSRFDHD